MRSTSPFVKKWEWPVRLFEASVSFWEVDRSNVDSDASWKDLVRRKPGCFLKSRNVRLIDVVSFLLMEPVVANVDGGALSEATSASSLTI